MVFTLSVLLFLLTPSAVGFLKFTNDPLAEDGDSPVKDHRQGARYIFLAGLEGSGHHFFQTVFEKCIEVGSCGNRSREFYRWAWGASKRNDPIAMRRVWEMEDPRPDAPGIPFAPRQDVVYPMNAIAVAGQMMSYPNYLPGTNPNMVQFAEAAASLGDSFKVVVLLRNPRDLLSSAQRRFNHTEDDLVQSMVEMEEQLKKMPEGSYRCLKFEKFNEVGATFRKFLDIPDFDIVGTMRDLYEAEPGCRATSTEEECPQADALKKQHNEFVRTVCAASPDTEAKEASLLGISDAPSPLAGNSDTDTATRMLS